MFAPTRKNYERVKDAILGAKQFRNLIYCYIRAVMVFFVGSWVIQARVFYDMPFEIPAAIALYYISRRSGSILVTLAGCTWLVAVALFTVMNYYLIPVQGMQ